MIINNIYGKQLSSDFNSKIVASSQRIKPKILIDWLDSRHSTSLSVSTDDPHSNTAAGDIGYYFTPKQLANGIERESYTWAVAGALDKNGHVIKADGTWHAMPSDLKDNFEFGWWSGTKSTSSVHPIYGGYSFASNPTVTIEFDSRKCNIIKVFTSEYYGQIHAYTLSVKSTDAGVPDPLYSETVTIPDGRFMYEHYLPESLGHDTVYRVDITIISTKNPLDYARVQEVNTIYQSDISDYVIDYDNTKTRDLHDSSLPIAGSSSGSISIQVDNTGKDFNVFSNSSTFGSYMKKDLKISVSSGWQIVKTNNEYIDLNLRSSISNVATSMSITDTGDLPSGGSNNYFVLTIDPDNDNKEHVWCSACPDTYTVTIAERGIGNTVAKSHNSNAVVRFETFEYPDYTEAYIDEWSSTSEGMTVAINATDWSKYLTERVLTNGFFIEKATVPQACEKLLMISNFPKAKIDSRDRFENSAKTHGAILHFDFNESSSDRAGNVVNIADGLRARFFAMPSGSLNKVKDITADALDRELSELEKALGEVSFTSPDYVVNSATISNSSMAINIGDVSGFSFNNFDGSSTSEYFNCVFDGFYIPSDDGGQYIVVDIANGGVRVYLDDTLILNEWRIHPVSSGTYATLESEEVTLSAGKPYKIRIESFHKTGDYAIKLKYAVGIYAAQDITSGMTKTSAVLDKIGSKNSGYDPLDQDRNKQQNYALYLGGAEIGLAGGLTSSTENTSCLLGSGKYIRLPSDSSWDLCNTSSSNYTGDWTIEMFVKPTSVYSNSGEYLSTWIDDGSTSSGFEFYSNSASNGIKVVTSTGIETRSSNVALSTSSWSHICASYNSSTNIISYYVNGQLKDSSATASSGVPTSWSDLTFGGRGASYNTGTSSETAPSDIRDIYFDEFIIYNNCLSDTDIENRYTEAVMQELTIYPFLYGAESPIRQILDEITLSDLGRFYIDELNIAKYEHYYRLFETSIDQHANVQLSINDSTHILSAEYNVQLQANKVVVKIAGISSNLVGTQSLWRASDPTTLAVVNLEANVSESATSMYVSSTVDPPFAKAGYLVIDNEIIKYSNKTPNQFLNLERGYFNTTAASHNANTSVREVRYWALKYDKAPAFQVKNPFITGIQFEEPDQINILRFVPDAYGAELIIAASNNIPKGSVIFAEGTNPITGKVSYTAVAGVPVLVTNTNSQIEEQVAELQDNIRLYGLKEIVIDNKFITDYNHGQKIANFIIDKMSTPVPVLNVNTIPNPKLQIGDRIRISQFGAFDIINGDYWVVSKTYQYGTAPTESLMLRKVV